MSDVMSDLEWEEREDRIDVISQNGNDGSHYGDEHMLENFTQLGQSEHTNVETFGEISIDTTLEQRGKRYGDFLGHSKITQGIKRAMQESDNWVLLSDDKKEALEMIAHKIGRILNGDPEYHDSWHDIIGYTKLIADTLDHNV